MTVWLGHNVCTFLRRREGEEHVSWPCLRAAAITLLADQGEGQHHLVIVDLELKSGVAISIVKRNYGGSWFLALKMVCELPHVCDRDGQFGSILLCISHAVATRFGGLPGS